MSTEPTLDQVVAAYVAKRNAKEQLVREHKQQLDTFNAALETMEQFIHLKLTALGVESIRTAHGTAYIHRVTRVSVSDWDSLLAHMLKTEQFTLLNRSVNKTAVEEIVAETGVLPPGVKRDVMQEVSIRATY